MLLKDSSQEIWLFKLETESQLYQKQIHISIGGRESFEAELAFFQPTMLPWIKVYIILFFENYKKISSTLEGITIQLNNV